MISTTRSFSPAACLLVAAVTGSAMGDVITVDDDDPGADFATIQEAVDAAVDGDRIEVWPGYYFGDLQTPDPVVKVDGKSIEIVAVNLDPTLTVIAGQGARRCVEWSNTPGDCKLVGFTLDSGYAAASGGGLLIDAAAVQVQECVFQFCVAGTIGGAIGSSSNTVIPPLAVDCTFVSNAAGTVGGGIGAEGGFDLIGCDFDGGTAAISGGGAYLLGNPAGKANYNIVSDCEFRGCEALYGGGIFGQVADLRLLDVDLLACIAGDSFDLTGWGGGIGLLSSRLEMTGGLVSGCEGGLSSGAIDVEQSVAVVSGVSFSGCTGWQDAGAIYALGSTSSVSLTDCSFSDCTAAEGGGGAILCEDLVPSLSLLRCSFDGNLAFDAGYCVSSPNVVTAEDCDFNAQVVFDAPVQHVYLSGVGTGSRFENCRFVDAEGLDLACSFRAIDIGGLEFVDCDFVGNRTVDVGGGVDTEGTIYISASLDDDSPITFSGCRFIDNRICCAFEQNESGTGGAIRVDGRAAAVSNCIFELNSAAFGGAVYGEFGISNSIVDGAASIGEGGAAWLAAGSSVVDSRISGSADCNYPSISAQGPILIEGCTITGWFGLPFFCAEKPVDLALCRLPLGSTVQDTRFCDYTEAAIDGDWIDLGGNSFNPDECDAADLNGDGVVNGADLALVLAAWGQPCLGCAADVNQDGQVNGADLALVLAGWG